MKRNPPKDAVPPPPPPSLGRAIGKILKARGWNDAGRDCWVKYQGVMASMGINWITGISPEQCERLLAECEDIRFAVQSALEAHRS